MGNKDIHEHITDLLYQGRLKQAIDTLSGVLTSDSDWELYTRFTEMKTAYGYMLDYLKKDLPDPNRETLYRNLIGECFIINDECAILKKITEQHLLYSRYRRAYGNNTNAMTMQTKLAENYCDLEIAKMMPAQELHSRKKELQHQHEHLLHETFYRLWTSSGWKSHNCEEVYAMLTDNRIRIIDRATLVSAITLGLLKCFDPHKAIMLCRMAQENEPETSTRALIGLLIAVMMYDRRIKYYPELQLALQSLSDDDKITKRIHTIQIQLLRCRETKKIDRKMREEIIPAMMKNPHLRNGKFGMDINAELDEDGQNPEWKEWMQKDSIKDKLDEMAKWQIEGADVYMSTFSQLKHFSFFEEMCNWFRPFDTDVPQIAEIIPTNAHNSKNLLNVICTSNVFCNSDKYSFCLTFQQVPQEQRDIMMQQINESGEIEPNNLPKSNNEQAAKTIGNQYIQDLYRFFNLSRYGKEFKNPFAMSLNMLEYNDIAPFVKNPESIMQIFHYLIDKEYYSEAHQIGVEIENDKAYPTDAQFYQKMGYSLQQRGKYKKAIDYYIKADIIAPDSLWTMRHIAQCYRLSGDIGNAIHYYTATEEIAPDNISLLLMIGECLAIQKRYDEAFERFFKVEYLDQESLRAWRAIAWCSYLTGNDTQARKYYLRLMQHPKASNEDFINAAHVEWTSGNKQLAYDLYKQAEERLGNTEKLVEFIEKDKSILMERGASENEIHLLIDLFY